MVIKVEDSQNENMLKLGPSKQMQGTIWDEKNSSKLVEILISHNTNGVINSITFTYREGAKIIHSPTYGKPIGSSFNVVVFDYPGEHLTSVSGEYSSDGMLVSLVFGTNKRKYGPFGRTDTNPTSGYYYTKFNYEFPAGRFGGFHGSVVSGWRVYAIGVYIKPYDTTQSTPLTTS